MNTQTDQPRMSFKPLRRLLYKFYLYVLLIWSATTAVVTFFLWLISLDQDEGLSQTNATNFFWYYLALSLVAILIAVILLWIYVRTMEFQIWGHEVVVRKGVINKTEKHVPYRTVTNISTRYGVFDRLFGIGTVEIETAGKSGTTTGPEEKIEGIFNYANIRDAILEELRKFRSQYATTTEVPRIDTQGQVTSGILQELREIKEILRTSRSS